MPHAHNRAAFLSVKGCGHTLLEIYGQLVAVELALKDHSAQWLCGHDVPRMLTELNDAGLTAVAVELGTELQAQHCTGIDGLCSQARSNKYTDLRYLRHESDFGTGHSTDAGLQKLLDAVQQVIKQLPQAGVSI